MCAAYRPEQESTARGARWVSITPTNEWLCVHPTHALITSIPEQSIAYGSCGYRDQPQPEHVDRFSVVHIAVQADRLFEFVWQSIRQFAATNRTFVHVARTQHCQQSVSMPIRVVELMTRHSYSTQFRCHSVVRVRIGRPGDTAGVRQSD